MNNAARVFTPAAQQAQAERGSAIRSRAPNRYAELIANQNYGERAKQQVKNFPLKVQGEFPSQLP